MPKKEFFFTDFLAAPRVTSWRVASFRGFFLSAEGRRLWETVEDENWVGRRVVMRLPEKLPLLTSGISSALDSKKSSLLRKGNPNPSAPPEQELGFWKAQAKAFYFLRPSRPLPGRWSMTPSPSRSSPNSTGISK